MSKSLKNIEDYLAGNLSADDRRQFEEDIKVDEKLRDQIDQVKAIHQALELAVEDDLRAQLDQLAKEPEEARPTNRNPRRFMLRRIAAAASIVLAISTTLWFVFDLGSQGAKQYAEATYIHISEQEVTRGGSEENALAPGFEIIRTGDLADAQEWFESWIQENPASLEARFILAGLYYDSEEYTSAKSQLQVLIDTQSVLWKEKAEWNMICVGLADNMDEQTRDLLDRIVKDDTHGYHSQALEIQSMVK